MTKIIIISYFFPPSNFVGGERTEAWVKNLHKYGVYPILITRNWNNNQSDLVDPLDSNEYTIEKTETYEIRRLPYKRTIRDRLSSYKRLRLIQKGFTFKELIFSNFCLRSIPYHNMYHEAKKILKQDSEVKAVIASGRPFQSFAFGHRLKKKFDILWIPDYRDEWTTHKHLVGQGGLSGWINKLERKSELRWTSNADFFIGVSEHWVELIGELIQTEGKVVLNGYHTLLNRTTHDTKSDVLTVTYAGTLYPSQDTSVFINSCLALITEGISIRVQFIGTNMMPDASQQILSLIKGHEKHFSFIPRVPRAELQKYIDKSDLMFLTSYENIKGWYPVKLFEYYASDVPILLCPSDSDQIEDFVIKTNSGYVANTEDECIEILRKCIDIKNTQGKITFQRNLAAGEKFSRAYQTSILAEHIIDKTS